MANPFNLRNGTILLSTEAPGGLYSSSQLKKIAAICESDAAIVKATEDQRLALFVKAELVKKVADELKSVGLGIRHYQDGVHQPVTCIGALCADHAQDSLKSAMDLGKVLDKINAESPLKIGINGCSRCCVPCHTYDISIVGETGGYRISLGGKSSQLPEMAAFMAEGVPPAKLPEMIRAIVVLFKEKAESGESLQDLMGRVGISDFVHALAPYSQDAAAGDPFDSVDVSAAEASAEDAVERVAPFAAIDHDMNVELSGTGETLGLDFSPDDRVSNDVDLDIDPQELMARDDAQLEVDVNIGDSAPVDFEQRDAGGNDAEGPSDDVSAVDDLGEMDEFEVTEDMGAMDDPDAAGEVELTDDLGAMDDLSATDELAVTDDVGTTDDPGAADELVATDDFAAADDMGSMEDLGAADDMSTIGELEAEDDADVTEDLGAIDELDASDDLNTSEDLGTIDELDASDDLGAIDELDASDDLGPTGELENLESEHLGDDQDADNLAGKDSFEMDAGSDKEILSEAGEREYEEKIVHDIAEEELTFDDPELDVIAEERSAAVSLLSGRGDTAADAANFDLDADVAASVDLDSDDIDDSISDDLESASDFSEGQVDILPSFGVEGEREIQRGQEFQFTGFDVSPGGELKLKFASGATVALKLSGSGTRTKVLNLGGNSLSLVMSDTSVAIEVDGIEVFYPINRAA